MKMEKKENYTISVQYILTQMDQIWWLFCPVFYNMTIWLVQTEKADLWLLLCSESVNKNTKLLISYQYNISRRSTIINLKTMLAYFTGH